MNYEIGTRIYYTGDMANIDGEGTIVSHHPADKWYGLRYNIELDDGREFKAVFPASFDPAPGRRFWTLEDWRADRARRISEMQAEMERVLSHETRPIKA